MTQVMLFHHAQGLTAGVHEFAERLRAAGHDVAVPDLYDGRTFTSLDAGVAHAEALGMDEVIARGVAAATDMPAATVFGGFSLGTLPAQRVAQTRPGALGALLYHGGVAPSWFGDGWPANVAVQVHGALDDPWMEWEDVRNLLDAVSSAPARGQLCTYPGDAHLFTDASLDVFDAAATRLVVERTLELLADLS